MQLKKAVEISRNYSQVMRNLGYNSRGGSTYVRIVGEIKANGYDTSHFKRSTARQEISEILVENSEYSNMSRLKERIINEGVLEYKCSLCGNKGEWNDAPLTLQLDHINGVNNDNRLENLRLLCPNCHSQTDTYAGKNLKNKL